MLPLSTTKDQKLRLLQYKINLRRVATNSFLEKIKIKPSAMCTFCNKETETIEHLFYQCDHSKNLIQFLKIKVNHNTLLQFPDNAASIILGYNIDSLALNYVILCLKYFIFKCKCQEIKPVIYHFKNFLKEKFFVEKLSYDIGMKRVVYENIWKDIDPTIFWN